jgi:hypothetical protein
VGLGAGLEVGSGHGWRRRSRQRALKRGWRQPPAGSRALVLWEVATISLGRRLQERTSSRSNSSRPRGRRPIGRLRRRHTITQIAFFPLLQPSL